jgi:hypothetical protein
LGIALFLPLQKMVLQCAKNKFKTQFVTMSCSCVYSQLIILLFG